MGLRTRRSRPQGDLSSKNNMFKEEKKKRAAIFATHWREAPWRRCASLPLPRRRGRRTKRQRSRQRRSRNLSPLKWKRNADIAEQTNERTHWGSTHPHTSTLWETIFWNHIVGRLKPKQKRLPRVLNRILHQCLITTCLCMRATTAPF